MRSEYKYLVPNDVLAELRAQLAPFMVVDRHGRDLEEKGYTVRSLYFDTASLKYYHEKKAGINERKKLRIRAYNDLRGDSQLFLEIKRKVGRKVRKNRAPVQYENLLPLFVTGDVDRFVQSSSRYPDAKDDARRFFYHLLRYNLRPTHLTSYEREAFLGRFDATLRITFDRNLRGGSYLSLTDIFRESELLHVFSDHFILEVKYNTRFPGWLRHLLAQYDLRNRALSKYCMCTAIHKKQHDNKRTVLANAPGLPSGTRRFTGRSSEQKSSLGPHIMKTLNEDA
jgi:VTC domain